MTAPHLRFMYALSMPHDMHIYRLVPVVIRATMLSWHVLWCTAVPIVWLSLGVDKLPMVDRNRFVDLRCGST